MFDAPPSPRALTTGFVLDLLEKHHGLRLDVAVRRVLFEEVESLVEKARASGRAEALEEVESLLAPEHENDIEGRVLTVLERLRDESVHLGAPDNSKLEGYAGELAAILTNDREVLEDLLDEAKERSA
jgi:hypothetical protein